MLVCIICSAILYGRQTVRNPATWARSRRKWNMSAPKYLDHRVGIDDLSDVWSDSYQDSWYIRILTCVSDPFGCWNSTRQPSSVSHFFFNYLSICCIIITFLRNSYRRVFSPPYFRHCFRAIFQFSIFSWFKSKCVRFNDTVFLVLTSFTKSDKTPVYWYIPWYPQLFKNFGH